LINQDKKVEYDITNIDIIEGYKYKEGNPLLDSISNIIIKDDLSEMLYVEDDLLLIS
jgi:hypothetical protein